MKTVRQHIWQLWAPASKTELPWPLWSGLEVTYHCFHRGHNAAKIQEREHSRHFSARRLSRCVGKTGCKMGNTEQPSLENTICQKSITIFFFLFLSSKCPKCGHWVPFQPGYCIFLVSSHDSFEHCLTLQNKIMFQILCILFLIQWWNQPLSPRKS